MNKIIIMFPGQGSQKTGMGDELFSKYLAIVESANELLQNARTDSPSPPSLMEICANSEHTTLLNRTDYTQPLLYLVNALHYKQYQENHQASLSNTEDNTVFVGHSLGEYNALQAAGAFDILTGFKLVLKRGELMNEAKGGAMAAVIGMEDHEVVKTIKDLQNQNHTVEVANFNSPGQIIISGTTTGVEAASVALKSIGAKKIIPLAVSGAFHSSMMKSAAEAFNTYLGEFSFSPLQHTVYANVTATPYPQGSDNNTQTTHISKLLTEQIYSSVQWTKQIQNLRKDFSGDTLEFNELGPGQVLTGLVKRIP